MGSSFMTVINIGLALYCLILLLKNIVQFGLPNHPSRFTLYLTNICVVGFFILTVLSDLGKINWEDYMRWRALPIVAGSLGLLLQVITTVGQFSLIQQKIISRIPLMGALLFFAIFPLKADVFLQSIILITVLFLSISVRNARYEKRTLLKMGLFVGLSFGVSFSSLEMIQILGRLLLFPSLFYFFIFEQSYGVAALIDQHHCENSGVSS